MSRRNVVETLPPEVRAMIRDLLYQSGFSDYTGLVNELQAQGHNISRSALHRFGKKLQGLIERAETEKMLAG